MHRSLHHAPKPFHTTYDAAGKLIEEYSTIVAVQQDAEVAYLTSDHLGSPRINTDANGAVVARHDYHPFGEEITTSQRTTGIDYAGDTVRKQFTGYEHDGETGLEFAQARMYSSVQGRFSTTDPILIMKDRLNDPQRWNLYAYTRNNPIRFTDPTGLYTCRDSKDCSSDNDKAFEAARQADLKSEDKKVRKAAEAYGDPNDGKKDNVSIGFATLKPGASGNTALGVGSDGKYNGNIVVTFNATSMSHPDRRGREGNIAHEGVHVADFLDIIKGGYKSTMTKRESEQRGYEVEERYIETHSVVDPSTGKEVRLQNPKFKNKEEINKYLDANPALYPDLDSPMIDKTRTPVRSPKP